MELELVIVSKSKRANIIFYIWSYNWGTFICGSFTPYVAGLWTLLCSFSATNGFIVGHGMY